MAHLSAFERLSEAFRDAFAEPDFRRFQELGVHSDVMLSLAAGVKALGELVFPVYMRSQIQQAADMGGMQAFYDAAAADPYAGLHNMLPVDALRQLSDHIRQWDPPKTALSSEVLCGCRARIQSSAQQLESFLEDGTDAQRDLVLGLGNIANMAETLERLLRDGITARKGFREAFARMPILAKMSSWGVFRAESLEFMATLYPQRH